MYPAATIQKLLSTWLAYSIGSLLRDSAEESKAVPNFSAPESFRVSRQIFSLVRAANSRPAFRHSELLPLLSSTPQNTTDRAPRSFEGQKIRWIRFDISSLANASWSKPVETRSRERFKGVAIGKC